MINKEYEQLDDLDFEDNYFDDNYEEDISMTDNVKPGRLTKKFQHEKRHKRRRKRIWQENAHHFYHPFGYYPVDKHGRYTENEDEIAYYKRYDSFEKSRAYLKRQSNKRARKYKDELTNPGDYRRVFDYWWELY